MGQAAKRQPQPWDQGPPDLLRRLLARRPVAATDSPRTTDAPDVGETPSAQDAAILVLKAALRAQRAEADALRTQLAGLRDARR